MTYGTKSLLREIGVMLAMGVALILMIVAVSGCSANHAIGGVTNHPGVKAQKNLFSTSIEMTSDGSASVDQMKYNAKENAIEINGLSINQKSSEAAKYDADKIEKIGIAQQWQVDYIRETWTGVTNTMEQIAPVLQLLASAKFIPTSKGFNLEVPGFLTAGKTEIKDTAAMQAYLQQLLTQVNQVKQATATQPANKEDK